MSTQGAGDAAILMVKDLRVDVENGPPIVADVTFSVPAGKVLGLVGESGSGKTTVGLALLGFHRPGVELAGGSVRVDGQELIGRPESELRPLRGRKIAYVPQDPATALTPSLRVGDQIREVMNVHLPQRATPGNVVRRSDPSQPAGGPLIPAPLRSPALGRAAAAPRDRRCAGVRPLGRGVRRADDGPGRRHPGAHPRPRSVACAASEQLAAVYVSHDLGAVAAVADRIAVMYAGRIVEHGPAAELLQRPVHPYTVGLISSVADTARPSRPLGIPGVAVGVYDRPPGCAFFDRCRQRVATCATDAPPLLEIQRNRHVRCPEWNRTPGVVRSDRELRRLTSEQQPLLQVDGLVAVHKTRANLVTAVDEVSFSAFPGECVALVGESGSGKTTLARCIAGLHAPASGSIKFNGDRARAHCAPAHARAPPPDPDRLPEPVRLAQPVTSGGAGG